MRRYIILERDNTRPHAAHLTLGETEKFHLDVLVHPLYSPDFTALDYHLFGAYRQHMGASTMEMTRQFSRPYLHSCKILKWSSITLT
jgi:hypothetical protein